MKILGQMSSFHSAMAETGGSGVPYWGAYFGEIKNVKKKYL